MSKYIKGLVQENNRKKNIKSKVCILQAAIIG